MRCGFVFYWVDTYPSCFLLYIVFFLNIEWLRIMLFSQKSKIKLLK